MTPSPKDRRLLSLASAGGTDKELVFLDKLEELTTLAEKTNELLSVPPQEMPGVPNPLSVKIEGAELVTIKGDKGDQGDKGEKGEQGEQGNPGKDGKDGRDGLDGLNGIDGRDGVDGAPGKDGKDGQNGTSVLPEDIEALKQQLLAAVEEKVAASRPIFGSGKTKIYKVDLSDQLNGVLKTFFIGTHFGIVSVDSSSAPFGAFRPDVDYQEVGRNIVFTSNVDETISLAQGQNLIVRFLR